MGKALPQLAAVTLCLSLSAGCVSRGEPGPAFPENYPTEADPVGSNNPASGPRSPQFGKAPKEPSAWDGFVVAMTDNPVARTFKSAGKSTANALTINPQETSAYDPVSLSSKAPKPDAEMYVSMARVQESGGNMQAAEQMFQQALQIDNKHVPALVGLGQMRFRQQKHQEAFAIFNQVRQLDPNNLEAILGQAHFHDTRENMPEASRLYSEATQKHPNVARTWNDLGLCLARQRRLGESQQALQKAVQLDAGNVLYRNNLATVLVELRRPDEALAHLQQAHGPAAGHYNLGFLLHRRGEDQAAAEQFQYALRVDPSFEAAKLWLDKINSGNSVPQRAGRPPLGRSAALLRGPDGRGLHLYTKQEAFASRPPAPPEVDHLVGDGPKDVILEDNAELADESDNAEAEQAYASDEDATEYAVPVAVEISDIEKTDSAEQSDSKQHQDQQIQPAYESESSVGAEESWEAMAEEPPVPEGFELDLSAGSKEPAKFTPVLVQPALVTGEAQEGVEPVGEPILPSPQYPVLEKTQEQEAELEAAPLPGENTLSKEEPMNSE